MSNSYDLKIKKYNGRLEPAKVYSCPKAENAGKMGISDFFSQNFHANIPPKYDRKMSAKYRRN